MYGVRCQFASVDFQEAGAFLQPPLPPPPQVRAGYASLPDEAELRVLPPPPPPTFRLSLPSLEEVEAAIYLAFFRAGEELERAYAVEAQTSVTVEHTHTFVDANRRRRFRAIVAMVLLPMSALAAVALLRM